MITVKSIGKFKNGVERFKAGQMSVFMMHILGDHQMQHVVLRCRSMSASRTT